MSEPLSGEPLSPREDNGWNNRDTGSIERERDQLVVLHSRALDLLSRCSFFAPENLKDEIEDLAAVTGRTTLMPVRVERVGKTVVIDPYNVAG